MRLEIGNFYVKDIVFGNELSYEDGILREGSRTELYQTG